MSHQIDPYDVELAPSLWAGKMLAIGPGDRENEALELTQIGPDRYRDQRGRVYRAEGLSAYVRHDAAGVARYAVGTPWQPFAERGAR